MTRSLTLNIRARGLCRALGFLAIFSCALTAGTVQPARAASGTWTQLTSGGLWSNSGNWSGGTIADGSGFTASFNTIDITADNTVHLDTSRSIGFLTFGDTVTGTAAGWTIDNNGGANILTLAGGTAQTITVSALGTGKQALISAQLNGATGNTLTKDGVGTVELSNANYLGAVLGKAGVLKLSGGTIGTTSSNIFTQIGTATGTAAALRQTGGTFNTGGTALGQFIVGAGSVYGAYELSNGSLNVVDPQRVSIRNGQMTQTGGAMNITYTGSGAISGGTEFQVAAVGGDQGRIYATAGNALFATGTKTSANPALQVGAIAGTSGDLTIAGTADWELTGGAGIVRISTVATALGNVNLNGGGRLSAIQVVDGGGTGRINFDGGTLRASASATGATFMTGLDSARIYAGGATFDSNGQSITIGQALLAPTGNVLNSINLATGGSGYIGAPTVAITGGGGDGATAIANYDANTGAVTGFTITNPGSGYTSAPTVTLGGGFQAGGSAATVTALSIGSNFVAAPTTGGLTKIGSGTLTLSGANTYTGPTNVNVGTLKAGVLSTAGVSGAFGLNSALTLANTSGVSIDITGFNTILGSLAGGGTTGGNVTLGAATLTTGNLGSSTSFGGVISGSGGSFTKTGAGIQTLTGVNLYSGTTTISAGTLQLGNGTTGNDGTINSSLSIVNNSALVFNRFGSSSYGGVISGSGTVTKSGVGTQILTGANLYGGNTTISTGTLQVNNVTGSGTGTGNIIINGGKFGGTGSVTGTVTLNSGGTIAPGASIESLNTGAETWMGNSAFDFEFSTQGTGAAGTDWDQLIVGGSLDMTGVTSVSPLTINLFTMSSSVTAGLLGTWDPTADHVWANFVTTSSLLGFSADKFAFNTAGFLNPFDGVFSVFATGNNLNLQYTFTPVPEPGAFNLLVLGSLLLKLMGKKRKATAAVAV